MTQKQFETLFATNLKSSEQKRELISDSASKSENEVMIDSSETPKTQDVSVKCIRKRAAKKLKS